MEAPLGMATTRVFERGLAAVGLLQEASPLFAHQQSVDKAGVLFAVPALIAQGGCLNVRTYTSNYQRVIMAYAVPFSPLPLWRFAVSKTLNN